MIDVRRRGRQTPRTLRTPSRCRAGPTDPPHELSARAAQAYRLRTVSISATRSAPMRRSQAFDLAAYEQRTRGPCFICEMLAGNPAYRHHLIYEDETAVVFLTKYPTLVGYTLVAPRAHREQ